jgi:hypothetical protein
MNENQRHFLLIPIVICLVFISVLIISLIPGEYPLVSAIPNDAGNSIDFTYITPINYSLIPTVNNSDYLDGYDSSYFYPASNPDGFINGESDTLQSVTDRGNVTTNLINLSGGLRTNKIIPLADSTTAMQFFKADGTTSILTLDTTNSILKSRGYLDIWFGAPTGAIKVGADVNANTRSSNTRKLASFTAPDYANTRNVEFFNFDSFSSLVNQLNIGGRSGGSQYGATEVNFLTAASTSTTGGAVRFKIGAGDSTTAMQFFKADGTTAVMTIDTTNSRLGIGVTPSAKIHALSTTEQLRLGYNASNYLSATVGSTGSATFNLTGTSPQFNYLNNVNVTGNITASQNYFVGSSKGLTASYNCTSFPNVTITGGIITSFSC